MTTRMTENDLDYSYHKLTTIAKRYGTSPFVTKTYLS